MVLATNLGFPRIGLKRELKTALESFWQGKSAVADLQTTAKNLRQRHWAIQKAAGLDQIPSNDFSYYDQVLDTIALTGAIAPEYGHKGGNIDLDTYFAMARGKQTGHADHACNNPNHKHEHGTDVAALEMTKWFDTNYHYIVPRLQKDQNFTQSCNKPIDSFAEAKSQNIPARPVLVGPVSFLLLSKSVDGSDCLALLPKLIPVYAEVLKKLAAAGATWVQIDEPCLVQDQSPAAQKAWREAYKALASAAPGLKILLATYFDAVTPNVAVLADLPVAGVHIDLTRGAGALDAVLKQLKPDQILSVGVIDGRNIWRTDLDKAYETVQKIVKQLGSDRVWIAPSCSLLHTPVDLAAETKLDPTIKSWLSFAQQKLEEIVLLKNALNNGIESVKEKWEAQRAAVKSRRESKLTNNPAVRDRMAKINDKFWQRQSPFAKRQEAQGQMLSLPAFPTTTIGSFPQTKEVRAARSEWKQGKRSDAAYEQFLKAETERTIRIQEKLGLDVLVHGEFERNDMVEYFGEQLAGFTFTENGWVQSYGSRCVKPPIIYGDVERKQPMTVKWSSFAQSLTKKPMKGMLTGPITILQWSFVRDDQPRKDTAWQISLAIRDEVVDLEKAGIKIIQIDEPAIREGLPLQKAAWEQYLDWSVKAFRISASGVADDTQIHTHMCYSEFNDILPAIAAMDADVISIETARSQMEILHAFKAFKYPNEIGPGVYDIHSPRVPSVTEMKNLLMLAADVLPPKSLWVNPDCGLKTRGWPEVETSLVNMVEAAKLVRKTLGLPEAEAKYLRKAG